MEKCREDREMKRLKTSCIIWILPILIAGLAAGCGVALERDDLPVLAPHLGPVGDLAGVDLLDLLRGEAVHRVVRIDQEHQAVHGKGGHLPVKVQALLFLPDDLRRLCLPHQPAGQT